MLLLLLQGPPSPKACCRSVGAVAQTAFAPKIKTDAVGGPIVVGACKRLAGSLVNCQDDPLFCFAKRGDGRDAMIRDTGAAWLLGMHML